MTNQSTEHRQRILRDINRAIDDLPMLPTAVSELMSLSISDDLYFEKVKTLAEQDPTFTARLIKVANSAASAPISQITSISHAVSRIGTRQIKGLITAYSVSKIFVPRNNSELNLWVHSIQVAVASQSIARMATRLKISPEQAYLCGLLHDIGRFILFNKIPDGPVRIDETDWESPEKLLEAEKEICGLTHAALGGYAAKKWGLPREIANVITNHHLYHYLTLTPEEEKESRLVQVIQMADYLSIILMQTPDILSYPPEKLQAIIEQRCVHPLWKTPPISPYLLQSEAQNIYDKASKIVDGLGICIDE
ncbi:MAG: HDOD domain-containing protein [Methylophaga sp.]|nr:HDOD domain-containing protein [Methylophaga sp.]